VTLRAYRVGTRTDDVALAQAPWLHSVIRAQVSEQASAAAETDLLGDRSHRPLRFLQQSQGGRGALAIEIDAGRQTVDRLESAQEVERRKVRCCRDVLQRNRVPIAGVDEVDAATEAP
jgi:porphobilinogen deaminase